MRQGRFIITAIAAVAAMAIGPSMAVAAPSTFTDDFAGGTGTNAAVAAGSVQLTRGTVTEPWDGTTLPAGWTASQYDPTGTANVAGGTLEIDGEHVDSTRTFSTAQGTQVLEFSARFASEANQHVGFANLGADGPWAIFSTQGGGDLFARTRTAAGGSDLPAIQMSVERPAFVPTDLHTYRIEWASSTVKYFVDGTQVGPTQSATLAGSLPVVMSDLTPSGSPPTASLRIDSLSQNPFLTSGSFDSRTFDSGNVHTVWGAMTTAASAPAGTSIGIETRSSTDGATFSAYQPLGAGNAIQSPAGRFIQYRATLGTADNRFTPSLDSVQIAYDIPATPVGPGGGSGGGSSSGGNSSVDKTAPKVTLAAKSLKASKKGTVSFTVGCPATEKSCQITLKLKNGKKTVASKTVTVKGGKTKTVTLQLNKATRHQLKHRSLKVSSVVSATDAAGNHKTTTKKFTLRKV